MRITTKFLLTILTIVLFGVGFVRAQDRQTINTIDRLERQTDRFLRSVDAALDNSRLDGAGLENDFTARVEALENAADRLREGAQDDEATVRDVKNLLSRAMNIEIMMRQYDTSPVAREDWRIVKDTLDSLARMHDMEWAWTMSENPYWRIVSERTIFERLENRSDEFRHSFNDALDLSRFNGTELEDNVLDLVKAFEASTDRLEDRVRKGERLLPSDVELILSNARTIDSFMRRHELSQIALSDWARVKINLDELAMLNNVIWRWLVEPVVLRNARY